MAEKDILLEIRNLLREFIHYTSTTKTIDEIEANYSFEIWENIGRAIEVTLEQQHNPNDGRQPYQQNRD